MAAGPEPDSFQKIVRWLILAFFVYVCVHSYFQKPLPLAPQTLQTAQNAPLTPADCDKKKKPFPLATINFFPLFVPTVHNEDVKLGSGEAAFCGQRVTFAYEYSAQQKVIDKGEKSVTLGGGDVPHGVEIALIGMKPGGKRRVDVPSQLAGIRNHPAQSPQAFVATLSLLEASPALPTASFPLRIINSAPGEGTQINCGDKIRADVTIWKLDGTVLFSTPQGSPLTFIVGQSEVPFALEQAAISLNEGSARLVVLPPGSMSQPLIKPVGDTASLIPPLPDEITVAQIENVQIADARTDLPASEKIKDILEHKNDTPADPSASPAPSTNSQP